MAYILSKNNEKLSLYSIPHLEGCEFKPKKNKTIISVNKVLVVDKSLTDNILSIKFNDKFKALLKYAMYVINNEDATSTDTAIVLDEVAMLKGILLNRYQKFLNQEKEELFLKKLRVLENELRLKQVMINKQNMQYYEKSELRGR